MSFWDWLKSLTLSDKPDGAEIDVEVPLNSDLEPQKPEVSVSPLYPEDQ